MNIVLKPYNLLGLAGILSLLSLLFLGNGTVDIHVHDTYFILSTTFLLSCVAAAFLLLWVIYKLSDGILFSKTLTRIHITITLLAAFVFTISLFKIYSSNLLGYSSWTTFTQIHIGNLIVIASLAGAIVQVLVVINIVGGILKQRK